MFLVGDVGGTHTRLALFQGETFVEEKFFSSKKFSSLEEVIALFLQGRKEIKKAAFGIAGPIRNRKCQTTNLPWSIDAAVIEKKEQIPQVFLLNDLEAHAYGISLLNEKEFVVLQKASHLIAGNATLISAGTGLGEAGLFWDGKKHRPFPCEGGHTDFAPRNAREFALWEMLHKKYGHVSYERLISGPGIEEIFTFLVQKEQQKPKEVSTEKYSAKIITENALQKKCPVCLEALRWFVSLYAAEAANLALKHLAFAGVYLGGGIAPKILPLLQEKAFLESFLDKGRFQPLLQNIPIKVILNDKTALLGALAYVQSC